MSGGPESFLKEARRGFHAALFANGALSTGADGVASIADRASRPSVAIARELLRLLGPESTNARLAGQMAGSKFEVVVGEFLEETLPRLETLRPGNYSFAKGSTRLAIADSEQYSHLSSLDALARRDKELAVAIGMDYIIKPDVMVLRHPEPDERINAQRFLVDDSVGRLSGIREKNQRKPLLHASVSCKWTLRSDRAQNARSEALNLVRNRKGRLPHIVVVTAEPAPNRLASIALGTGDIDCVYHIALPELEEAVRINGYEDAQEMLSTMVEGSRLRDIADLPLDLAV